MATVTRAEMRQVLERWRSGQLHAGEVNAWAGARFPADVPPGWEYEDEVVGEVLAHLDLMDMNLTTSDDVPAFLEALSVRHDDLAGARALIAAHRSGIDFRARQARYAADPFYGPFCTGDGTG